MMKGLRYALLIMFLVLLAACGSEEEAAPTAAPATDAGETAEQVAPPTETPAPAPTNTLPPPVVVGDDAAASDETSGDAASEEEDLSAFGYGIQSHATIGDPAYSMEVIANQLGLEWVKVQLRWADVHDAPDVYHWEIWDAVIAEATKRDIHVMLSIVTAPPWTRAANDESGPPDDYGLYYEFLSDVLTRYPDQVAAVEIWNEQNIEREWRTANGVAPADYVNFLKGAYETVKRIDSDVIVISGALSPTGVHDPNKITSMDDFIWTDEAISLGMLDYADCVGVHHNGYNLPPDVGFDEVDRAGTAEENVFQGPWANPHHSWSFATTLATMADKVQAAKPEMRLCVTEFGWASSEGYDAIPQTFEFALDNTLEEQAQYIVQAFQQMRDSGDVWLAFLFNLDYGNKGGGPTDDAVPYSIVDVNGVPRPAFDAISRMEK